MGKRFTDINRGGELKLALDNITKYRTNVAARTTSRVTGNGTPKRRIMVPVGIFPFSVGALAAGQTFEKYIVKMSQNAFTGTPPTGGRPPFGKAKIDNYYTNDVDKATSPETGFSPARVSTFESTGPSAYEKSKFTQLYYAKTPGTAYHYPIGRPKADPATMDERNAKKTLLSELSDEIKAATAGVIRRVSFKDEKMGGLK